jgi:phosphate/sulfate permease
MVLFIIVVLAAIAFEYINGFHDAANAIATVVSTKVLTPRQAIALAAFFNLTGALMGTAVASTIGKGIVDTKVISMTTALCALLGAIIWNLVTWWMGLPSSSSHALIGGLCGAAVASARGDWSVLKWNTGLLPKVVAPMFTSPVIGFLLSGFLMALLFVLLRPFTPHTVHKIFGRSVPRGWRTAMARMTLKKQWASSPSPSSPARRAARSRIFIPCSTSCTRRVSSSPSGSSFSAPPPWLRARPPVAGESFARLATANVTERLKAVGSTERLCDKSPKVFMSPRFSGTYKSSSTTYASSNGLLHSLPKG